MQRVNIAVLGAGMIGAAHASAYRAHLARLSDEHSQFILHTICDAREEAAAAVARSWGFERVATDWQQVVNDPVIDVISVALPNALHAEVAAAALRAGKHVICEKPLAMRAADAWQLKVVAEQSRGISASVFNYRRIPAIARIKQLLDAGEIGELNHVLIQYQCAYAADPQLPWSWRYQKSSSGGGASHDLGAHAIDLARFLAGDIAEISAASSSIVIPQRYVAAAANAGHSHVELTQELRPVDNDDVTSCLMRFASGCQGLFSTSRTAVGMRNRLSFTLQGSRGTLVFNSERPGEFQIARAGRENGDFVTVHNEANFPYISSLVPVPHGGVSIGYAECFGFMIAEFMQAIAEQRPYTNGTFADGYAVLQVLEAIERAAAEQRPVAISDINHEGK